MGYLDGNLNMFSYGTTSTALPYIPTISTQPVPLLFGGEGSQYTPSIPIPMFTNSTISNLPDVATVSANIANSIVNRITSSLKSFVNKGVSAVSQSIQNVTTDISNFGQSMVAKARTYLGYNEKNGSYKLFTQGRTEAWCADFVSYVARQCGKTGFNFPSVQGILDWGIRNSRFSKTPKVGDAIIFKSAGASHTGIVTRVENGRVYTIEGNTSSNNVAECSYSLSDKKITGYVTIA